MMKPTLYMMIGIPGSGKSYWANSFCAGSYENLYISRDQIRAKFVNEDEAYFSHEKAVYREFSRCVAEGLRQGHNVIADATHNTDASRQKLIRALQMQGLSTKDYNLVFVCMMTPVETCIQRDAQRTGRAHVTEKVIRDFQRWTTWPKIEDYDNLQEVIIVHG